MRRYLTIAAIAVLASMARAEITQWWGQISFRQRHEVYREYVDVSHQNRNLWGTEKFTENNSVTRVGYQIGLVARLQDNLTAGLTLRSGLGSVMWQDIDNAPGLLPGVQEAYITWRTPYPVEISLGKIPQAGNAMWDLFAAPLWVDYRQYDPTDGLFNDRISALSGARVRVPFAAAELRAQYHTDYSGGLIRTYPAGSSQKDEYNPRMDQKVFLLGGELRPAGLLPALGAATPAELVLTLSGDYGWAYRERSYQHQGSDSVYAAEYLWGLNLKAGLPLITLQAEYGFNWRDSVFRADYLTLTLTGAAAGFKPTVRYEDNKQTHLLGIYKDHVARRRGYHFYFNYVLWNLDLQPRYILFTTKIDDFKAKTRSRYELTATYRF